MIIIDVVVIYKESRQQVEHIRFINKINLMEIDEWRV
jgi:hypothetical protein